MTDEKTPQTCPSCGQPTWDNGVLMFHLNAAHDNTCPAASFCRPRGASDGR